MDARAAALIDQLGLQPHPEGGFYREVYRSTARVRPEDGRSARPMLTAIHYLLVAGAFSRWHRVRSDEVWHFHEGDPLALHVAPGSLASVDSVVLGSAPDRGQLLLRAVPAGCWQAARPVGRYALVSCAVGPGFEFEDFTLLGDDPDARRRLALLGSEWGSLV